MIAKTVAALHGHDGSDDFVYGVLRSTEMSLSDKDLAAASFLTDHAGPEWIHARQAVAAPLLELHARADSDNLDAIESYSRILVEAENPSADLMAFALPKLESRWADEEIADAAAVTLTASSEWLAENCTDCRTRRTSMSAEPATVGVKKASIEEGVATLRSLAH